MMCPICWERSPRSSPGVLPCVHDKLYHKKCLEPWIASSRSCPSCRKLIPSKTEPPEELAPGSPALACILFLCFCITVHEGLVTTTTGKILALIVPCVALLTGLSLRVGRLGIFTLALLLGWCAGCLLADD